MKPVDKVYKEGELNATIENCYFINNDFVNKLFGCEEQKANIPHDLPNRPATSEVINSDVLPSSVEGQQITSGGPVKAFYTEPATNYLPATEDRKAGKIPTQNTNPAQDSLSQEILRSFKNECLQNENDQQAIFSFLAEQKLADEYNVDKNISNIINEKTIDKICLQSSHPEEILQIKKEQIQHLSKEERNTVTNIIRKYPKFWSSNKYAIGKFKGFKAEIELIEGASAYQKE